LQVQITKFVEADRRELTAIYQTVRQDTFTWVDKNLFELSSFDKDTQGELIWVAKIGSEIVGFISVWNEDNFIHHLYIKRHYQRCGIGTMLLKKVTDENDTAATLKCLKDNKAGVDFYLKNGWEVKSEGLSDEGPYLLLEDTKRK
jgi:ribosomal protein S18 acetylase RimI-like enzyme